MKSGGAPATQLLRPVLDTYLNAAVAITGCHAAGIARSACEVDVLVVTNEQRSDTSVRKGGSYFDLYFLSENQALNPQSPELAVALAHALPVRDVSLILSTSSSANKAVVGPNSKKCAEARLGTAVKALGRTDEALSKGSVRDADFWLLVGAYEFAHAWLYSVEGVPAPSHLLRQLRERSRASPRSYEAFSRAAGLERASRVECKARLEGLEVLTDVLGTRTNGVAGEGGSPAVGFEILRGKAEFLMASMEQVDSYSFLGLQLVTLLPRVSEVQDEAGRLEREPSLLVETLSKGKAGLLGERLIRELGLARQRPAVESGLSLLREQVSKLAKRI